MKLQVIKAINLILSFILLSLILNMMTFLNRKINLRFNFMWNSLVTLGGKNNGDEHNLPNFKARKAIRAYFSHPSSCKKESETQRRNMNCSRLYNQ